MEATADRPLFPGRGALPAWLLGFLVPLLFDRLLAARDLTLEDVGSACSRLTPAAQAEFDTAVLPLQITLAAWAVAGAVIIGARLSRLESHAGSWLAMAGWVVAASAATLAAWIGPTAGGVGQALLLIIFAPIVWVACALVLALGLAWRRASGGHAFPLPLLIHAQAVLGAILVASAVLGGTGAVEVC